MKKLIKSLLTAVIIVISPILVSSAAVAIARLLNCCQTGGASCHCVLLGIDIGFVLQAMAMFYWVFLLALPIGAIFAIVSVCSFVYSKIREK